MSSEQNDRSFIQKVWLVAGVLSLSVLLILLIGAGFRVLLLVLAGVLIAVFFRGLGEKVQQKTNWKPALSLSVSTVFTILLVLAVIWLSGAKIREQANQLAETLPETVEKTKADLRSSSVGHIVVDYVTSVQSKRKIQALANNFFSSTLGIIIDLYVVIFLGLFFTVSPKLYTDGIIRLAPRVAKNKTRDIINSINIHLRKWLKGKMMAMVLVFVLTAAVLLILGTPMWLLLALIAGVLNFIPNFGPLVAMLPAVLIGSMQGINTAILIAVLYSVIQIIESIVRPNIQKRLIKVPPALILIAQVLMGVLTGVWGVILATPLLVIVMVILDEVYIPRQNEGKKAVPHGKDD